MPLPESASRSGIPAVAVTAAVRRRLATSPAPVADSETVTITGPAYAVSVTPGPNRSGGDADGGAQVVEIVGGEIARVRRGSGLTSAAAGPAKSSTRQPAVGSR